MFAVCIPRLLTVCIPVAPPPNLLPSIPIKFAPLIAGNGPISCEAVKLVKFSPEPEKEVAVAANTKTQIEIDLPAIK